MRSANPALNDNTFARFAEVSVPAEDRMTLMGTVHKTGILLALVLLTSGITWKMVGVGHPKVWVWAIGGAVGGLIFALITCFVPRVAAFTAPCYALLKGLFLGAISALFEQHYPGIVVQAIGLTFGVLFALLAAYRSGLIKATENFKLGVCAATGGILLLYFFTWLMAVLGVTGPAQYIHGSGTFGICFSLFVVVIAALNLVLDFDFIEDGAEAGAPKYMEWVGAFGLMVTLIWLYIEILHLLAKLRR